MAHDIEGHRTPRWLPVKGRKEPRVLYFRYCPELDAIEVKPKHAPAEVWTMAELKRLDLEGASGERSSRL